MMMPALATLPATRRVSARSGWAAARWRIASLALALAGISLIYPWRSVDNAVEVVEAQRLVDSMSRGHQALAAGEARISDFALERDGFVGFEVRTSGGIPSVGLIGPSGDHCLVMHWTAPFIAQVGRLEADRPCVPDEVTVVPLPSHRGYVPGTGPPFDVTPLIREAHTPIWFIVALVVFTWVGLRAGLDLFVLMVRPDHFFDNSRRRRGRVAQRPWQ